MIPNGIPPSEYDLPLPSPPPNWKILAPYPPNSSDQVKTYEQQSNLPHLPVPSLADTLGKLKNSLQAMAISEEEYSETVKRIDEFGKQGGVGETLQKRLENRREAEEREGGRGHWLEEWWDEVAYMGYRDSVRFFLVSGAP
jgi:carnitine O-acetyltransferase